MDLTFTELDTYYDELNNATTNTLEKTLYNDNNFINNINNNTNNIIVSKKPQQYNPFKRQTQVPQQKNHSKKNKISYDDILSSMNTVVIDGKLEFIRNDRNDKLQNIVENQPQQKKVTFSGLQSQSHTQKQNNYQSQINKSSYIYNKFFKNYKEPTEQYQNEEPHRPLTKKEFIKQLIINRANAINERNRIAEIKSTKLLFNNNNNRNIIINSRNISNANGANGLNHLFNFK
jgi:hypothetical protein